MSTRTFLFCDICNPQGVRYIEQRRNPRRGDTGKRITDGRAWYEGDIKRAVALYGWKIIGVDKHACPRCVAHGKTTGSIFRSLRSIRQTRLTGRG